MSMHILKYIEVSFSISGTAIISHIINSLFSLFPIVSLSNTGGGIGPHTDDYDVFLIQMAGIRRWDIGKRKISTKEELNGLVDGLDVRILSFWDE